MPALWSQIFVLPLENQKAGPWEDWGRVRQSLGRRKNSNSLVFPPPPNSPTKLSRSFYSRPTLDVASDLLGKVLVRRLNRRKLAGKIVETEAYVGPHDLACHVSKGHT